jgi:two-component system, response regulator RegA
VNRLLLVDDDAGNRLTLSALLEDEGFEVTTAASFAEAASLIERGHYDLAILDQHLGDGLGTDLATSLRDRQPKTGILLLSGSCDAATLPAFIDSHLPKGVHVETLLTTIRKILDHRARA